MPKVKPYTDAYTLNKELLKKLVRQSGGIIDDLADKIGISKSSLIHYMQGIAAPGLESLIKISTYFEVPIDILIGLHTEEEYAELLKGNAVFMEQCKKRAYEDYLLKLRPTGYPDGSKAPNDFISPYPYNLLDCLFQEPWPEVLDEDHLNGLYKAMEILNHRELTCLQLYFRDGKTLEQCGKELGLTRERIRQIVSKGLRKLRHPARMKLIRNGFNGSEIKKLEEQEKEILERKLEIEKMLNDIAAMQYKLQEETDGYTADELALSPNRIFIDKLDTLDLSFRSYNCLLRAECNTISQILTLMEDGKIFKIRNLGKKSIEEIQNKIGAKYHLEFTPKFDGFGRVIGYACTSIF